MFDQTTANVKPYLDAGTNSLSTLMSGVNSGLYNPTKANPTGSTLGTYSAGSPQGTVSTAQQLTGINAPANQNVGINLPANQNTTIGGAPALSSYGPQSQLAMSGSVGSMTNVTPAQQQEYQQYQAMNPYQSGGAFTADKFQQDPGYQFQLQQGLDALTNKSSLAGGMNSNNMKGLIGYAQGMANTDYQQAFQNYQTEQGRSLTEYNSGLQNHIQQFLTGQSTDALNNQVTQNNFGNQITAGGFNNNVTQQQYQDAMQTTAANNQATQQNNQNTIQTTGLNNQVINNNLANTESVAGFNNSANQQNFGNAVTGTNLNNQANQQNFANLMAGTTLNNNVAQGNFNNNLTGTAFNNAVSQQDLMNTNNATAQNNQVLSAEDSAALQRLQINNQDTQQEYNNLASLAGMGLGAGLQQGQIGAQVGSQIGNNIIGAGNANASGIIGSTNALTGAASQGYNQWLMSQYLNKLPAAGAPG